MTACPPARAEDLTATVVNVRDGDTVTVRVESPETPALLRKLGVRFRGCDAPELRDKRPRMAALAREAKACTSGLLAPGDVVTLRDVRWDKYGGRVVATVVVRGRDVCAELISHGLARPYDGHGARPW